MLPEKKEVYFRHLFGVSQILILILTLASGSILIGSHYPLQISHAQMSATKPSEGFTLYSNSSFGIKGLYPSNWTVQEGPDYPNDGFIDIVAFESPYLGRLDDYPESVLISIDTLPKRGLSLEQYAQEVAASHNLTLVNFTLNALTTNHTLAGNHTAYKMVLTNTEEGDLFKTMEMGMISGSKVYLVTYIALEKDYLDYLPIVEQIVNSFNVVNNNVSASY